MRHYRDSSVSHQYGYQISSQRVTSNYDLSKENSHPYQNSRPIEREEPDLRDSYREPASCQNSNLFCGYPTGRSCGSDSQVVMDHHFHMEPVECDKKIEYIEGSQVDSSNEPNKKRAKGKGIKDLVTSVSINQQNNALQVQMNP